MINQLTVAPSICDIVLRLQNAGYETYVVGGAIRDLLLGRTPKDYDISTAATPEEIRAVFGRRLARIIGKRFKLVHLTCGREIIEISTFRAAPDGDHLPPKLRHKRESLPEKMILDDNQFGTSEEDAWRRDFSVNALFLDPNGRKLYDHTTYGLKDMSEGVVRAIGDAKLRFEEDPVRMLRALKLVGQYGFSLEPETERALRESLHLIQHAAQSRLSLELEKILRSTYCDRIFRVFREYGFLRYFLPFFAENWDSPEMQYALRLLAERNLRIERGCYRSSISIAIATMVLPFLETAYGNGRGNLWNPDECSQEQICELLTQAFAPHCLIKRISFSACRILATQPLMRSGKRPGSIMQSHGYLHAREAFLIQNEVSWHQGNLEEIWSLSSSPSRSRSSSNRRRRARRPAAKVADTVAPPALEAVRE